MLQLVSDLFKALHPVDSELKDEDGYAMNEEIFSCQHIPRPSLDGEPMLLEEVLFVVDRVDDSSVLCTLLCKAVAF